MIVIDDVIDEFNSTTDIQYNTGIDIYYDITCPGSDGCIGNYNYRYCNDVCDYTNKQMVYCSDTSSESLADTSSEYCDNNICNFTDNTSNLSYYINYDLINTNDKYSIILNSMNKVLTEDSVYDDYPGTFYIENNTSQEYLHVFVKKPHGMNIGDFEFNILSNSDSTLYDEIITNGMINYDSTLYNNKDHEDNIEPAGILGAGYWQEFVISKDNYIVIQYTGKNSLTDTTQFIIAPLYIHNNIESQIIDISQPIYGNNYYNNDINELIPEKQYPIKIEITNNAVGDVSGVDGVNFGIEFGLTGDFNDNEIRPLHTKLSSNPCSNTDSNTDSNYGCINPIRDTNSENNCVNIDRDDGCPDGQQYITEYNKNKQCYSTNLLAACKTDTQQCAFNDCTSNLFNIPEPDTNWESHKYYKIQDSGKQDYNEENIEYEYVKSYVSDLNNFKSESEIKNYCEELHSYKNETDSDDSDDRFSIYCYDYDDQSSSPGFRFPFLSYIIYSDLDS